ncbi:MAG: peptidoglycan DD-metalloendopeptidase family protein [Pseudomonadales bacterium]|nr:peptidoglycan DD-metalloendopeptidase family protein [Pseudomonadales bacterium]
MLPYTTAKKTLSLITVLCLLFCNSWSALADDDVVDAQRTEKELKQVKKKIQSLQHIIKKTQNRHSDTEKALRKSELEISGLKKDLRQVGQDIQNSKTSIRKLTKEKSKLEDAKNRQKTALVSDIQAAYRTGRQEYIKLLLNQQEPEKLARVLKYYDYFHRTRLGNIQTFNDTISSLEQNQRNLDKEISQLEDAKKRLEVQKQSISDAQARRKKVLLSLQSTLKNKDQQLKQLNENEKDLHNLLKAVQETLADLPADVGNTTPFAKRKGKLSWPSKGRIARSFRSTRQDSHLRWNGVLIRTANGATVKSVHRGRVVFSDWMRGFGLLTIIDHGDSYYTLYGHSESLLKEAGDWVESGEAIAYAGASGGQEESGLYFEIRKNGKPVNPKHWCRG